MFKSILKSFSTILILAAFFYSCGEQSVQPPASRITNDGNTIYEKLGIVKIVCNDNGLPQSGEFETGELNTSQYSKIVIKFKGETNSDGSLISVFLSSPNIYNQNIYTVRDPGEINQTDDHSIDVEDPAEKIWLSFVINIGAFNGNGADANFKYTKVSDLVVYGIR